MMKFLFFLKIGSPGRFIIIERESQKSIKVFIIILKF